MRYFPNITRVRALTSIRRVRALPRAGRVIVRLGQEVTAVQVVATVSSPENCYLLNASEVLGVEPEELERHLLVEPGMQLEEGSPIMRQETWYGRNKLFRSPIAGYLELIRDGYLVVIQEGANIELRAMMPGRVAQVFPGRSVALETRGALVDALWDSGKEGFGRLRMVASGPGDVMERAPGSNVNGKVIVAGQVKALQVLKGLEAEGARGLICGSMPSDLARLSRTFSFPVVVTDGIGEQPMARPIFELLQQSEGREASLFPAETGDRPQRTQIIIPLPTSLAVEDLADDWGTLQSGSMVRIMGLNQVTLTGTVYRTYAYGKSTAFKNRLSGADVLLTSGEVLFVPYTNLDLIS